MNIKCKYNNYDLHPCTAVEGFENQAWAGTEDIVRQIKKHIEKLLEQQKKVVVCMDTYVGVRMEEIISLAKALGADEVTDTETLAKSENALVACFDDYMTDDRVFGIMCHKKLEDFFESEKIAAAAKEIEEKETGVYVVAGLGASLVSRGDIYVYCDMTRWEIQLRYRAGMPNWHRTNSDAPILTKYKCGFFIEWRLADRHKAENFENFDYILETESLNEPKLITGDAFRAGLKEMSTRPFRLEPYFDPGVWGGHWMQENFGLDKTKENFAWSFDGVPEENAINLKFGDVTVKLPAMDLVLYQPKNLLGGRVYARFGAEFPIRFDLLDTMGGGNLSLQVHPLTKYIQDQFGMHYTQDESYYFLDADEDEETYMYLGVKENVDREAMARDLALAEKGEILFPAEKYVNKVPVKKHDHVAIPAGTIHCSGSNNMVLEISATPYIFTFKLWDWGRVGLDGIPRPIHLKHGLKNIQWDRDTQWIYDNIVHQEKTIHEKDGVKVEKTGLHAFEFIDTFRYNLETSTVVNTEDSVHVVNLVDGRSAFIESTDESFEPFEIHYAETAVIPAKVTSYKITPQDGDIKLVAAMVRR